MVSVLFLISSLLAEGEMQNENERVHLVPSDIILCEIATRNSSWNHPVSTIACKSLMFCLHVYVCCCEICYRTSGLDEIQYWGDLGGKQYMFCVLGTKSLVNSCGLRIVPALYVALHCGNEGWINTPFNMLMMLQGLLWLQISMVFLNKFHLFSTFWEIRVQEQMWL